MKKDDMKHILNNRETAEKLLNELLDIDIMFNFSDKEREEAIRIIQRYMPV